MNVSQHRRLNVLAKLIRYGTSFCFVSDDEWLTHSGFRNTFDEITVHRSTNTKREHVGLVQVRANMFEHTLFTRDITVSDQHDAARDAVLSRQGHRFFDRSEQLRATAAALLLD